jgi:tetratricopeptide (TPR) repeat protein
MNRPCAALLAAAALLASACASAPRRPVDAEAYLFPSARPGQLDPAAAREIERAWRDVMAGDAGPAERRLLKLLRREPGLAQAETALAYARLQAGRLEQATVGFEEVLGRAPEYVPALAGAGSAALRRGDSERALELYRRAVAVEPGDARLRRRLAELKLQVTERRVAAGRAAREAGRFEEAVAEYGVALDAAPEVAEVRLELAGLLEQQGDPSGAVAVLEGEPGGDRGVLMRLAELLQAQGEPERALGAYRALLARDPADAEAQRRADELRQLLEFQRMPEEYRQIYSATRLTRGELAALISVKVTALSRLQPGPTRVAVDISGSWAREHIIKLLALDVLEVYPNHTFQPAATVRRGDLARAVGQLLTLLGWKPPASPALSDMSPHNLFYDGAARAVAAGLMSLTPAGAFEPWRPVSGAEAVAVLEGLVRLVGP